MSTNQVFQVGDSGIAINKIQGYLNVFHYYKIIRNHLTQDGIFGSDTKTSVQQFQYYASVSVDGIVGEDTWDMMMKELDHLGVNPNIPVASSSYYLSVGSSDLSVYKMQSYLNRIYETRVCQYLEVDGIYGSQTQSVVMQFQEDNELDVDGILGWQTWDEIISDYLNVV